MISVVIPLYNKEKIIERSLQSVLSQDYDDFEVVVVNDGSTDGSMEIVKSISDSRVTLIEQENGGPSKARNTGVKNAKGEWILFLDADDELLPGALRRFDVAADKVPEASMIVCSYYDCYGDTMVLKCPYTERWQKAPMRENFFGSFFPRTGAFVYKRELALKYLFNEELRRYEDLEILLRLYKEARIYLLSEPSLKVNTSFAAASGARRNIKEDFLGHIDFKGKSFWERMSLYQFYLWERDHYPQEIRRLYPNLHHRYDLLILYKLLLWQKRFSSPLRSLLHLNQLETLHNLHKGKTTLIIGNGFDIDLGFKTRYDDFVESRLFPNNKQFPESNLCSFIIEQKGEEKWGGIEAALEDYALRPKKEHTFKEDIDYYNGLCGCFRAYLGNAVYGNPLCPDIQSHLHNEDSCAAYFIIESILFDNAIDNVISFNYTPFVGIVNAVNEKNHHIEKSVVKCIMEGINFLELHKGSNQEMVLGISSDAKLVDTRYNFLKKSHIAPPPPIWKELQESERLIFWGFSFSKCDQPYFRDFFKYISYSDKEKREIFIVTKNEESKEICLANIENMLGDGLTPLFLSNEVTWVFTDKGHQSDEFSKLLSSHRKCNKVVYNEK